MKANLRPKPDPEATGPKDWAQYAATRAVIQLTTAAAKVGDEWKTPKARKAAAA